MVVASCILTVHHHSDIHKVDLATGLHSRLTAVHPLVSLGHLVDLEIVVGKNLEPAFRRERDI